MAIYYASPTGSDANDGLTELTPKTLQGACTAATGVNDQVVLLDGTYTLATTLIFPTNADIVCAKNSRAAIIAGNFLATTNAANARLRLSGICFKNFSGTNGANGSMSATVGNTSSFWHFEDCEWDGTGYIASRVFSSPMLATVFTNCDFKNLNIVDAGTGLGVVYDACFFDNIVSYVQSGSTKHSEFEGCIFNKVAVVADSIITATAFDSSSFRYCTFNLKDGRGTGLNGRIFNNTLNSPGFTAVHNPRLYNCIIYNVDKIINNTSTSVFTILGPMIKNNWIKTGTDTTGYTSSGGDVSGTDPLFYDENAKDFRIKPTSTAAVGNNGLDSNIGAIELEAPSTFYSGVPENKVENAYNYRELQLAADGNNKTGTLSSAGETDANKVLNTSTVISGNVVPVALSDVRAGVSAMLGTGTLDLPSVNDVKKDVVFDNTTKTGTLESTDPGEANVVDGTTYKINSISKTGSRTSIYPLLPANNVESGIDRGNGTFGTNKGENFNTALTASQVKIGLAIVNLGNNLTGTYVAAERYSDPGENKVKHGTSYKFNSETDNRAGAVYLPATSDVRDGVLFGADQTDEGTLDLPSVNNVRDGVVFDNATKEGLLDLPNVNNVRLGLIFDNTTKTGTLDVEAEANLPLESDVLTGSGSYGPELDKVPSYSPDFPAASNVRETDTTNGITGLIPNNKIAPSQGGSYLGQESNDNIDPSIVLEGEEFLNLGETKEGTATGSGVDPKYILYPLGTLGEINRNNLDVVKQLTDNASLFLQNLLGDEWQELRYFKDVEKNDFYNNAKQFGIRATDESLTFEKIGNDTVDLGFEIKLTNDFTNQHGDDLERAAELVLIEKMEAIRRQLRSTKFFKANNVRIVRDFNREEVEKFGTNGLVCRATVVVNIDVKNA